MNTPLSGTCRVTLAVGENDPSAPVEPLSKVDAAETGESAHPTKRQAKRRPTANVRRKKCVIAIPSGREGEQGKAGRRGDKE